MTDPITKTVTVPLDPARAFHLFTAEITDWWPLETHSLAAGDGDPPIAVTITPEVGGAVFETRADGSTAPWGHVTEWTPGRGFAMAWHVGRPESQGTRISVSFGAVADGTRVTLVHDNWQALGNEAATLRARYDTGWDMVLGARYAGAARRIAVKA